MEAKMRRQSLDRKMKDELRKRRHTLLFAPAFAVAAAPEQAGAGALSLVTWEGILGERFRFDIPLVWDGS